MAKGSGLCHRPGDRRLYRSGRCASDVRRARVLGVTPRQVGAAQLFSEFVATFGLLSVIWGCVRQRPDAVPLAVGAYITAAYWFTSSTSFANPAVTLARAASNTFAGIRPADAPGFILAQLLGAAAATALFRWLVPSLPKDAPSVLVAHPEGREQEVFKVELGSKD